MSRDHASRRPGLSGATRGDSAAGAVGKRTLVELVQRRAASAEPTDTSGGVRAAAAHGTSGPAVALPHADRVQQLFGRHEVSGVRAYVGGPAAEGAAAMGAQAFATGDQVAFGQAPDLHTAAHEAAHVVQQRAGVHLKGEVGQVGDTYERHADAVADRVVQGESAEPLLDQLAPATGHAGGAGAAAPIQRLQTRIGGKTHEIAKADLRDEAALEALFDRLALAIPAGLPQSHFTRVNKLSAAIEMTSPNWKIFMDVLGAINDGKAPNWELWDANELNPTGPADPHTLPGGSVEATLQALVKAGKHQDAVDLLCARYRPAGAVGYTIKAVDRFVLPDNSVVENDAYANVLPGQTVINLNTRWIERFILSGQIANLINVIEHEATHVKQNLGAPGVTAGDDDLDVREFEAYCREIQVTIQRSAHDLQGHLATRVEFEKAVTAATTHRQAALGKGALAARHAAQWEHIQAALPATRARLDETDRTRDVYARDQAILSGLLARHHELSAELSGLYDGDDGANARASALSAEAAKLQVPHVLARLPAAIAGSAAVETYHKEHEAFLEFDRHRRLPRRPRARAQPTPSEASSSSLLLPPPPSGGRSAFSLPPPPSGAATALLPPPLASSGAHPPSSAPPPSATASVPQPALATESEDEEWGDFTGVTSPAPLHAPAPSISTAPAQPQQQQSAAPPRPGSDDEWTPFS